jgi:hypothetical protein
MKRLRTVVRRPLASMWPARHVPLGRLVRHMGGLLNAIGDIVGPGFEGITDAQQEKYRDAKRAVRELLTELRDAIDHDDRLPDWYNEVESFSEELPDLRRVVGERPWMANVPVALMHCQLIGLKRLCDDMPQENVARELHILREGDEIVVKWDDRVDERWPIDPGRHEDAERLAREIEDTIKRCDYPGVELARRLRELAPAD